MLGFDKNKCVGCGVCVAVCPYDSIIQKEKGETPYFKDGGTCGHCGHCVSACSQRAVSHTKLDDSSFIEMENRVSAEDIDTLFNTRRSIRNFKKKIIPEEDLQKIIKSASASPTDRNSMDVELLVIMDEAKRDELEAYVIAGFREYIAYCLNSPEIDNNDSNLKRLQKIVENFDAGLFPVFREAPCVVIAYGNKANFFGINNSLLAMDYMALKAHTLGVGTCIVGLVMYRPEALDKFFNLPEDKRVYSCMVFGYSKYKYRLSTPKKEINVTRI